MVPKLLEAPLKRSEKYRLTTKMGQVKEYDVFKLTRNSRSIILQIKDGHTIDCFITIPYKDIKTLSKI